MKKTIFDWQTIIKDSAKIMAESIATGKKDITTLPALYKELEKMYKSQGKKIPQPNTYRQYMHKALNIRHNQKTPKDALYQLAGKYDKMTLDILVKNTDVTVDNGGKWLFIRLKRNDSEYADTQKHLYFLSHELKKKFSREIIFISFDTDTLVIMCRDDDARNLVFKEFKNA